VLAHSEHSASRVNRVPFDQGRYDLSPLGRV